MELVSMVNTGDAWNPVQTESVQAVIGVQSRFTALELASDLVRGDDKLILLDSAVTPDVKMRLRDSGTDYSIINVSTVQPGDTVCLYRVQVRV